MLSEVTFILLSSVLLLFISFFIVKMDFNSHVLVMLGSWIVRYFISLFASLFVFLFSKTIDAKSIESYDKKIYKIYSLKNMNETTGSFVLGGGRIENTEYYYFYRRSNGAYFRDKIEVENTVLYETNMVEPALYKKIHKFESRTGLVDWSDSSKNTAEYILKVPHGTISNRFEAY